MDGCRGAGGKGAPTTPRIGTSVCGRGWGKALGTRGAGDWRARRRIPPLPPAAQSKAAMGQVQTPWHEAAPGVVGRGLGEARHCAGAMQVQPELAQVLAQNARAHDQQVLTRMWPSIAQTGALRARGRGMRVGMAPGHPMHAWACRDQRGMAAGVQATPHDPPRLPQAHILARPCSIIIASAACGQADLARPLMWQGFGSSAGVGYITTPAWTCV